MSMLELRGARRRAIGSVVFLTLLAACRAKSAAEAPRVEVQDDIAAIESTLDRFEADLSEAGVRVALRELTPPPGFEGAGEAEALAPETSPEEDDVGEDEEGPTAEPVPDARDDTATVDAPAPATAERETASRGRKRSRQSAAERCERIRELAAATCELKTRICELAARHPDAVRYEDACLRAEDQCRAASAASTRCDD